MTIRLKVLERARLKAEAARLFQLPPPEECRRIRLAAGWSQPEVAAILGVTHSAVSLWESGRSRPTRNRAEKYRELLEALRELVERQRPEEAGAA